MTNPLLYALTVLIWGSTWFGITFQIGVVPEDVSVAYRFAIAGGLLLLWCLVRGRRLPRDLVSHAGIALQGLTLFSVNYVLFYLVARHLTSGLVAVVFSTVLLMNIAGSALVFGTRPGPRVLAGAAAGLAGVCLLFWPELSRFDLDAEGLQALLLGLLATACASVGNLASAWNQRRGLGVVETNALGMAYGAAIMAAIALARGSDFAFDPRPAYVVSLLYLAVFGSIVAFGSYLTLLGRIGPGRAAYAMVLFPVIALGFSTVFEGFVWDVTAAFGVAAILGGNWLVLSAR